MVTIYIQMISKALAVTHHNHLRCQVILILLRSSLQFVRCFCRSDHISLQIISVKYVAKQAADWSLITNSGAASYSRGQDYYISVSMNLHHCNDVPLLLAIIHNISSTFLNGCFMLYLKTFLRWLADSDGYASGLFKWQVKISTDIFYGLAFFF